MMNETNNAPAATETFPLFIGRNPLTKTEIWAYNAGQVAGARLTLRKAEEKCAAQLTGRRRKAAAQPITVGSRVTFLGESRQWEVVSLFAAGGFIPSATLHSLGPLSATGRKYQTNARIADLELAGEAPETGRGCGEPCGAEAFSLAAEAIGACKVIECDACGRFVPECHSARIQLDGAGCHVCRRQECAFCEGLGAARGAFEGDE